MAAVTWWFRIVGSLYLLEGIGLTRDDVFVANVLKCRPPGNRDPQPAEIRECEPHLFMQVSLIRPRMICTLGNFATKLLSGRPDGISRVHGCELPMEIGGLPVLLYPLYTMAQKVGLNNSGWSIVIIFTVIQSAFGTYLLASVLGTFPRALLEAAALDGANSWTVLWKVVFPIVRPTLSVLMIFFFIWTWNEFFIPLVMLTTPESQTVPIALASLQGDRMLDVPTLNAGALVSLVPTLIFFLIFQRTLTRGVTAGAVK